MTSDTGNQPARSRLDENTQNSSVSYVFRPLSSSSGQQHGSFLHPLPVILAISFSISGVIFSMMKEVML
jgi:hypothetical protein